MSFAVTLNDIIKELSEENYDEKIAQYRFWLDIGSRYGHIDAKDQVNNAIWSLVRPDSLMSLIHPTAHLVIRFIGDMEADQKISKYTPRLHMQYCTPALHNFFSENLDMVRSWSRPSFPKSFFTNVNLIARWANLGYVEEETIRDHILQSLTSHPALYDHQADALFILFKLAGATFEAYADPLVIDRCFELFKVHYGHDSAKSGLLEVCPPRIVKGSHRAEMNFQEVVNLRDRGWKGLPPPPVFTTEKAELDATNQKDLAATPVITCLGIPNRDLEPEFPQPSPPEPTVTLETDTIPGSPILQSPSISITTLSDFTAADTADDEPPFDSTTIIPHDTFYFEDGNVEVLCGNTLFRVHASVLSLHSPVLGQMFTKANLATTESPNGCPRILSSDAAADFTTLLKIIYLPVYVILSMC